MACSAHVPVVAQPKLQPHSPSPFKSLSRPPLFVHSQLPHLWDNPRAASLRLRAPHASRSRRVVALAKPEPLRVMISGAPASGKGTQCELITEKMVKERLLQPDSLENGWLLDGYPRSSSQGIALREYGIQPDLFILLEVPEEILVERVVGRRLDPVTGKIYHLKYSPPETEEIAARLTQRFDDTEEKVKLRLRTHHQNVEAVLSMYEDITIKVNGDASKWDVFKQIDNALTELIEQRKAIPGTLVA
ncbi:adenylate kinase 2, chloroplastic isoform X2 [Punica granatum]|uniref:adenylate kinase n=1 Tax=Punica granatum TaxID=22663 RepID=A0A6P8DCS7_PUNGR|nr:adenylate kinase 2, chloroplastic isoform X2 [Punica granatum]